MPQLSETACAEKFNRLKDKTLWPLLKKSERELIEALNRPYRFTFQELRQITEIARDFEMWGETSLEEQWDKCEHAISGERIGRERKKRLLGSLSHFVRERKQEPKRYPKTGGKRPERKFLRTERKISDHRIFGTCPVASEKTVCCNLKTIDAVSGCAFGCSYCTIQTFYGSKIIFDAAFGEKLRRIPIDPARFYHIGTGQSSDSLIWGNKNGILDDLCEFAARHPNILLELKTKSANVSYFLDRAVPPNVVLSWSLNTNPVVEHEEHFTASCAERLEAAGRAAARGIPVAFHFHPVVYYEGWDHDYPALANQVQNLFRPEQVLFISFGSITLIKPVVQEIRRRGQSTKILQMEMCPDPHGKLTYPDSVKRELFGTMHEAFRPWEGKVFMYLCMEHTRIWDGVFGRHYSANDEFEADFGRAVIGKIAKSKAAGLEKRNPCSGFSFLRTTRKIQSPRI